AALSGARGTRPTCLPKWWRKEIATPLPTSIRKPHSEATMMNDEVEALATLRDLGLKAIAEACDTAGASSEAHDAFRDALADYSDDVLWRLFERAAKPD